MSLSGVQNYDIKAMSGLNLSNTDDNQPPPSPPPSFPPPTPSILSKFIPLLLPISAIGLLSQQISPILFQNYPLASYASDSFLTIVLGALAIIWVKAITHLATTTPPKLDVKDSRKIIHATSAPLFLLLLPLYSHAPAARLLAATVPLANIIRLISVGVGSSSSSTSNSEDDKFVRTISRSGSNQEALAGPLIYAVVLAVLTVTLWTDTLVGTVAVSQMAVGDGLADIVGRRYGSTLKWTPTSSKSVAGSVAFVAGATTFSFLIAKVYEHFGTTTFSFESGDLELFSKLLAVSVGCAGVELIERVGKFKVDDNISVPLVGVLLGNLLLTK